MEALNTDLEEQIIKAFDMMWGSYDEPVRLIHRSFRIVAGNKAYISYGGATDVKCNATNPELHVGCKAMEALRENQTKIALSDMNGTKWYSYWVPVSGCPDYFIHFTNGMNEYLSIINAAKTESK